MLEAMNMTQRDIKAVKRSQLISTVKKDSVTAYPGEVEQQGRHKYGRAGGAGFRPGSQSSTRGQNQSPPITPTTLLITAPIVERGKPLWQELPQTIRNCGSCSTDCDDRTWKQR